MAKKIKTKTKSKISETEADALLYMAAEAYLETVARIWEAAGKYDDMEHLRLCELMHLQFDVSPPDAFYDDDEQVADKAKQTLARAHPELVLSLTEEQS